jgi:hypothetical protein
MRKEVIAKVFIELVKEPGAPAPSVSDVEQWVLAGMAKADVDGPNGCRYSEARVLEVRVV